MTPPILINSLCGKVAEWATRQSPYMAPAGLTEVLKEFQKNLKRRHQFRFKRLPDFYKGDKESLTKLLRVCLLSIPQVRQWNERKSGNKSPIGFVCSHFRMDPDEDFIDLDALVRNIVRECIEEARRFS